MDINKKIINKKWKKFILRKDIKKELKIIKDNIYNNVEFINTTDIDPEIIKYGIIYSDIDDINTFINNVLKYIYYNSDNKKDNYNIRKYIDNNKFFSMDYNTIMDSLKQNGIIFINYSLLSEYYINELVKYLDNNYGVNWLIYSKQYENSKQKNKRIF